MRPCLRGCVRTSFLLGLDVKEGELGLIATAAAPPHLAASFTFAPSRLPSPANIGAAFVLSTSPHPRVAQQDTHTLLTRLLAPCSKPLPTQATSIRQAPPPAHQFTLHHYHATSSPRHSILSRPITYIFTLLYLPSALATLLSYAPYIISPRLKRSHRIAL